MKRAILSALAMTVASVVLIAQTPQTTSAPPQFRAGVDLVHLDVSVLDKSRRPVRGLTAADFTVTENGRPQTIAAFTPVDVPGPEPTTAKWMRDVAADMRSNTNIQQLRLFVIAIDDATIENDVAALKSVKDIARRVIDKLGPSDLASVIFTRDNRGSQDFTADRALLLKAVETFSGGARGMSDVATSDDLWFLYSAGVLARAVNFLADLPEQRKAILYIGQGVPFDLEKAAFSAGMLQIRLKEMLTDLFDRARRSHVSIYPIDPCGLRVPPPARVAGAKVVPATCVTGLELDYLENLASATGGRPVINSNDPGPGIDAAFDENSFYYLLGYQPADAAKDGKFRKLDVHVNRPGVEVRTRSGYDAPREASSDRPRAAAAPLTQALSSALPTGDLPMQLTAAPFAVPGKPEAAVLIAVGFKQPIRQAVERTIENVDLQVAVFNSDGRSFGDTRSRADVTIRQGATGAAEYEVFAQIDVKPGRYQLRVAANVGSLDTAGSVYFDVDVPDFVSAPISMSGLLVSVAPGLASAPKDLFKPLVPVLPTTRRSFRSDHAVSVFGRVYQGGKGKLASVTARLTVRDTKDAIVIERSLALPASEFGSARAADLKFDLPTTGLPAGAYVMTIEVPLGPTTARRDSRFQVVR